MSYAIDVFTQSVHEWTRASTYLLYRYCSSCGCMLITNFVCLDEFVVITREQREKKRISISLTANNRQRDRAREAQKILEISWSHDQCDDLKFFAFLQKSRLVSSRLVSLYTSLNWIWLVINYLRINWCNSVVSLTFVLVYE